MTVLKGKLAHFFVLQFVFLHLLYLSSWCHTVSTVFISTRHFPLAFKSLVVGQASCLGIHLEGWVPEAYWQTAITDASWFLGPSPMWGQRCWPSTILNDNFYACICEGIAPAIEGLLKIRSEFHGTQSSLYEGEGPPLNSVSTFPSYQSDHTNMVKWDNGSQQNILRDHNSSKIYEWKSSSTLLQS